MGEIIMRNWDIRDVRVRVNLPFPILQVWLPIQRVWTLIRGCLNSIRQVVPLISHILHIVPIFITHLFFLSTTLQSSQNTNLSDSLLRLHAMIRSYHSVQHTLSSAFPHVCLSPHHSPDYELTPKQTFWLSHASLRVWPPPACSSWERKEEHTSSHSHSCNVTKRWMESKHCVHLPPTASRLTTSKYSLKHTPSRPPSTSSNSVNYSL